MKDTQIKQFIIIGKANAGKTLFLLNFAEYLGYKDLTIKVKSLNDEFLKKDTVTNLKKSMVSENPNTTKGLQVTDLTVAVLKGKRQAEFVDSTGLSSSIHFEQDVREGMAQTITILKNKNILFHIIDAESVLETGKIDEIDMELYKYGKKRGNYIILVNKIDLVRSHENLKLIHDSFPGIRIVEMSALCKTGFAEVRKYVSRAV